MSEQLREYSVPEAARLLRISERAVRDKLERGTLPGRKEGRFWRALLSPDEATATAGRVDGSAAAIEVEVIERPSRPALTDIEQAVERIGQRYVGDIETFYTRISAELTARYQVELAAKDETIAAQRQTILTQERVILEQRAAITAKTSELEI